MQKFTLTFTEEVQSGNGTIRIEATADGDNHAMALRGAAILWEAARKAATTGEFPKYHEPQPTPITTEAKPATPKRKVKLQETEKEDDSYPVCPEHTVGKRSKFGGYYCPIQDDNGYCKWTSKKAA